MDDLGSRLRAARIERDWTLEALSERCGLSTGFLSQVERGQSTLSIVSLSAICRALSIPIATLFSADRPIDEQAHALTRASEQLHIRVGESPVTYRYLTNQLPSDPIVELLIAEFPPDTAPCESHHEGEELGYVLSGRVALTVGTRTYTLRAGDSYRIPPSEKHIYATKRTKARVLMAVTQRFVETEARPGTKKGAG